MHLGNASHAPAVHLHGMNGVLPPQLPPPPHASSVIVELTGPLHAATHSLWTSQVALHVSTANCSPLAHLQTGKPHVGFGVRDQEPRDRSQRLTDRVRFGGEIVFETADHPDPRRVEKNHEPDASISHAPFERKCPTRGTP